MHNLFLVYFVNLYMFRAYLDLSSEGTTVCIQQLVLIIIIFTRVYGRLNVKLKNKDNNEIIKPGIYR